MIALIVIALIIIGILLGSDNDKSKKNNDNPKKNKEPHEYSGNRGEWDWGDGWK